MASRSGRLASTDSASQRICHTSNRFPADISRRHRTAAVIIPHHHHRSPFSTAAPNRPLSAVWIAPAVSGDEGRTSGVCRFFSRSTALPVSHHLSPPSTSAFRLRLTVLQSQDSGVDASVSVWSSPLQSPQWSECGINLHPRRRTVWAAVAHGQSCAVCLCHRCSLPEPMPTPLIPSRTSGWSDSRDSGSRAAHTRPVAASDGCSGCPLAVCAVRRTRTST